MLYILCRYFVKIRKTNADIWTFNMPFFVISSISGTTSLLGIANPSPSTPPSEIFKLLMPMTSPAAFSNAPPEFPGLMAASVWITFNSQSPADVSTFIVRSTALTIPCVTVPENPDQVDFRLRRLDPQPEMYRNHQIQEMLFAYLASIFKTAKSLSASFQ